MAEPVDRCTKAYLQLVLSMVLVGSSVVAGKLLLAHMPVFLASGLRFGIAAAVLGGLAAATGGARLTGLERRDLLFLFLQAFVGVFLFGVLLLYGLRWTTASEAGIILSTAPAVTALASVALLGERLTGNRAAAIALAVLGILLLQAVGVEPGETAGGRLQGDLLVFGAVLGEALFTVLGKLLSERLSPLTISASTTLLGFLLFLPFALWEASTFPFGKVSVEAWLLVGYYGVFGTGLATILWYQGLRAVSGGSVALLTAALPVSAVLLSYALLREPFRWAHVGGILLVLLALAALRREEASTC